MQSPGVGNYHNQGPGLIAGGQDLSQSGECCDINIRNLSAEGAEMLRYRHKKFIGGRDRNVAISK